MIKPSIKSLFDIDLRSLLAFRVAAGFLAIYDGLIKFPHIRWLYSPEGYRDFSANIYDRSLWIHQVIAQLSLEHWQLLIVLQVVAGFFLVIGWRPKVWLVIWLIILRLTMRRNDLAAHIGDLVFTFFCYWILFLPLTSSADKKFLHQKAMIPAPATLPYFVQLFSLYCFAGLTKLAHESWQQGVFFLRNIQAEEAWQSYSFMAQFPTLLQLTSWALPVLQIAVSLLLLVSWKKPWIRGFYIVFWAVFHFFGYLLVPDATMYWFLMVPLLVLIPKEFWNFLAAEREDSSDAATFQSQAVTAPKSKMSKTMQLGLVLTSCFVIVSSNYLTLYHYDNPTAQKYFRVLSRLFVYQYWFVFTDFSSQHNNYVFLVREQKQHQDLIELPLLDRADSWIAGRFHVMKRAIHNPPEKERWVAALCLDQSERRQKLIYSIVVRRYVRRFSDQPPIQPTVTYADEQEYRCDDLIARHRGRYN